jgi:hypothetical protein
MKTVSKGMKLSTATFEILKNFASLNSNILVKPGNRLTTVTPIKNVLAEANVTETFETEFGIWDLNKFLGTLSLFDDPELEFHDKFVKIKGKGSSVKYYYCEPNLLTTTDKTIPVKDVVVEFDLTEKNFSDVRKAASVLGVSDLSITNASGTLSIIVFDKADKGSNNYTVELDTNIDVDDFDFHFKIETLKLMPGDYKVSITKNTVSQFKHKSKDLTYFVALERTSSYKG